VLFSWGENEDVMALTPIQLRPPRNPRQSGDAAPPEGETTASVNLPTPPGGVCGPAEADVEAEPKEPDFLTGMVGDLGPSPLC
jgi:hypothetical protein